MGILHRSGAETGPALGGQDQRSGIWVRGGAEWRLISNLGLSVCWVSAFRGVKGAKPPSPITKAGGVGGGLERPDARR